MSTEPHTNGGEGRAVAEHRPQHPVVHDDAIAVLDTARFEHMARIATAMARARLMPAHLRGDPANCLMVVEQAVRWNMSPFAVAQKTYEVGGKLGFEGQLLAAVVNMRAGLKGRLRYTYEGDPDDPKTLVVTVSGTLADEDEPRTVRVRWIDGEKMSKGAKDKWQSQPEQQLAYFAARVWARRHTPDVIMGAYGEEELEAGYGRDLRDVTPRRRPGRIGTSRLDALAAPAAEAPPMTDAERERATALVDAARADDSGPESAASKSLTDQGENDGAVQNGPNYTGTIPADDDATARLLGAEMGEPEPPSAETSAPSDQPADEASDTMSAEDNEQWRRLRSSLEQARNTKALGNIWHTSEAFRARLPGWARGTLEQAYEDRVSALAKVGGRGELLG